MFSPPIINDYINQLEALKREGKDNTRESDDIINKYNNTDKQLNESSIENLDTNSQENSWLLHCIGIYYYDIKDYSKAVEWYTKSTNLGNTSSMFRLGCYYKDIDKNYPKYIEWFIKSANLGSHKAMNNLGVYYLQEKSIRKAFKWFIKSANLGNTNAIQNLKRIRDKRLYNYIYELLIREQNLEIKNILLDKLPKEYIFNKQEERINELKSVKHQGIDKVLCNQVLKHF